MKDSKKECIDCDEFKEKVKNRLKNTFRKSNELEKETILELLGGLLTYDYEDYRKIKLANTHFPLLKRPIRYVEVQTNFGTFNIFMRRIFYGKSGTAFHPDFMIFINRLPKNRENPKPDAIIEIKSGKISGESHRNFIFQLLVATIDFQPKIAILVTEKESKSVIQTAIGYDGLLTSYGIEHIIKDDLCNISDLLNNGVNGELTKNKIKSCLR